VSDDLTAEEREILAKTESHKAQEQAAAPTTFEAHEQPAEAPQKPRKATSKKEQGSKGDKPKESRNSAAPAQYDGDGWGDLPVQMRG